MRIVMDIDGVLADFIHGFTAVAHYLFDTPVRTTAETPSWDFSHGLTTSQRTQVWEIIEHSGDFWRCLLPLITEGERRTLAACARLHEVYFVTDRRGASAKQQTEDWLRKLGIETPTVILAKYKGDMARAVRADVLVDDKAGNAVFAQYHSPETTVYLIDRPYNQFDHGVLGSRIVRVAHLGTVFQRIAWPDDAKRSRP